MKKAGNFLTEIFRIGSTFDYMHMLRGSFEEIYLRVAFMLAERFGKNAEVINDEYKHWRDKGEQKLREEMEDYKFNLTEADRKILDTIVEAGDLYRKAKEKLLMATALHEKEKEEKRESKSKP